LAAIGSGLTFGEYTPKVTFIVSQPITQYPKPLQEMKSCVQIKLFADLNAFTPPAADRFPIAVGTTVRRLLEELQIPAEKVRLVFIDNVKRDLDAVLRGGERIGIFPPIGGG